MQDCGKCQECCKETMTQTVKNVVYETGTICAHLTCKGCGIYTDRPKTCKGYNCGWKQDDSAPIWMRPDKSKAIINRNTSDALVWKGMIIDYVVPTGRALSEKVMKYLVAKDKPFRFMAPKGYGYTVGAFGTKEFMDFVAQQGIPGKAIQRVDG